MKYLIYVENDTESFSTLTFACKMAKVRGISIEIWYPSSSSFSSSLNFRKETAVLASRSFRDEEHENFVLQMADAAYKITGGIAGISKLKGSDLSKEICEAIDKDPEIGVLFLSSTCGMGKKYASTTHPLHALMESQEAIIRIPIILVPPHYESPQIELISGPLI